MTKPNCPDFEIVLDYVLGLLSAGKTEEFRGHLPECADCRAQLTVAQELIEFLRDDAALQVPETAHRLAISLFQQARPQARPGTIRRFAKLILDSGLKPGSGLSLAAGLRAGKSPVNPGQMRQLLYAVENSPVEVDLQLRRVNDSERVSLIGQVIGAQDEARRVELVSLEDEGTTLGASPDETFTFRFQNLAQGEYCLNIYCGQELIEVTPLVL